MENGFIKLYRQIQNWEWYTDSATVHFFIHCILSANWKDKKWQGKEVKRGQFITSYANLSLQTGLSVKQIRTRIERLEESGEIKHKGANNYSVITVCKYNTYQPKHDEQGQSKDKQRAIKGQSKGNNEEGKEYKKVKNIGGIPKKSDLIEYFTNRGDMIKTDIPLEAENFINHYEDRNWKNTSGKKITEWKRQASTWNNNYKKYNAKRLQNQNYQPEYMQEL